MDHSFVRSLALLIACLLCSAFALRCAYWPMDKQLHKLSDLYFSPSRFHKDPLLSHGARENGNCHFQTILGHSAVADDFSPRSEKEIDLQKK